ncbi:hypothetical protein BH10BAC5_BH10BAC5_11130 [soil metagenome]
MSVLASEVSPAYYEPVDAVKKRLDIFYDCLYFFALIAGGVFLVYYVPRSLNNLVFIVYFVLYYKSKREYVWIAFLFFILDQPGYLFSGEAKEELHRLPLYSIIPGFSFSFTQVFIMVMLVKAYRKFDGVKLYFKNPMKMFAIYFVFMIFYSVILDYYESYTVLYFQHALYFTLFLSLPRLLQSKEQYIRLCYVLCFTMVIVVITQIYILVNGEEFVGLFYPNYYYFYQTDIIGYVARAISGTFINMSTFMLILVLLTTQNIKVNKTFLNIFFVVCMLSILITGTRGWILGYLIVLPIFLFFTFGNVLRTINVIFTIFIGVTIGYLAYANIPILTNQIDSSVERLTTVEKISEGDESAGGTLLRLTERGPRVMKKFLESPVFGWGFGEQTKLFIDGHVGNHSILLVGGAVGGIIMLYFWVHFLFTVFSVWMNLSSDNPLKSSLFVFIAMFFGIFFIHSTSTQMFGYAIEFSPSLKIFFLAFFFTFANYYIIESKREEEIFATALRN